MDSGLGTTWYKNEGEPSMVRQKFLVILGKKDRGSRSVPVGNYPKRVAGGALINGEKSASFDKRRIVGSSVVLADLAPISSLMKIKG